MNPSKDRIQYLGPQHKPGFRPTMFDTNEKEQTKKTGLILTTLKAAPVATGCFFMTIISLIGAGKTMGKTGRFQMWLDNRLFYQSCTLFSIVLTVHLNTKRRENEAARKELASLMATES